MAPHSSTLAWMEEPGGLQSMESLRVGHNWATSLSLFTFMHWRRKWQPTPVFLPGESQGRGSLVDCRLWGRTESDMTEVNSSSSSSNNIPCSNHAESPWTFQNQYFRLEFIGLPLKTFLSLYFQFPLNVPPFTQKTKSEPEPLNAAFTTLIHS